MSGIAGIIHFDGAPADPRLIVGMTAAMSCRGPDGIHHWIRDSVALGHCMLHATPESVDEQQPVTYARENLVLVLDGRLDNRLELRNELQGKGRVLRNDTDAELVLASYCLWGEDSPSHLLGDFAYVVWDENRRKIFCARDHFGVKPFYCYYGPQYFAFASDEEAFLGLPGISYEPDENRIASVLVPQFEPVGLEQSWLRDISKLPPGNILTIEQSGRRTIRSYWQLEPQDGGAGGSDIGYEEEFLSIFSTAVRCRMRSLGHPALMLSGGIDSASIAGMARAIMKEMPRMQMHTFSVVSSSPVECPETRMIHAVVNGYEHYAQMVSLPDLQGIVTGQDVAEAALTHAHPVSNSILLPAMMYLAAERSGHRVMHDGIDGDLTTSTSIRYMVEILRLGEWRRAWMESQRASVNNSYLQSTPPMTIFLRSVWDALASERLKLFRLSFKRVIHGGSFGHSLINRDFAADIRLIKRLERQQEESLIIAHHGGQREHIHALTQPGITRGMEGFDRIAARYSVEPRHPWADMRLVELYLRLPLCMKVRDGWTKYLVRSAISPWLGTDICWNQRKDHLGWRFVDHLFEKNRERIRSALELAGTQLGQYINQRSLQELMRRFDAGPNAADREQVFMVITLTLWLDRLRMTSCRKVDSAVASL